MSVGELEVSMLQWQRLLHKLCFCRRVGDLNVAVARLHKLCVCRRVGGLNVAVAEVVT